MKIPFVTMEEMKQIDKSMVDEFGIDLTIMMENAGKNLAIQARRMLKRTVFGKKIAILVGKGNNGGGGLVAARHLQNWGATTHIVSNNYEDYKKEPKRQLEIIKRIGSELVKDINLKDYDLIIDALIGYGLNGNPKEPIATLIRQANSSKRPILSLDVPSGLDSTTGKKYEPCINATVTLTIALPKTGLIKKSAKNVIGDLFLSDISIPNQIYKKFNIKEGTLFRNDFIIKLR